MNVNPSAPRFAGVKSPNDPNSTTRRSWLLVAGGVAILILGIIMGAGMADSSSGELDRLEAENATAAGTIDAAQNKITSLESQAEARDTTIADLEDQIAELDTREAALDTREQAITDREAELDAREVDLDALEAEIEAREQEVAEAENNGGSGGEDEGDDSSVYYDNCDAVRSAGADPIRVGEPGYGSHLDRDGDGVGCE